MLLGASTWRPTLASRWLLAILAGFTYLSASLSKQQAPPDLTDYLNGPINDSSPPLLALVDYSDDISEPRALWRRNVAYDESSLPASLDYDLYRSTVAIDSQPELQFISDSANEPGAFYTQAAALQRRLYSPGELAQGSSAGPTKQPMQVTYASQTSEQSNQQQSQPSQPQQQQQQPQQQPQQKSGPQFIKEPPSFIHYLNSSDLVIPCAASGNPTPTIVSSSSLV